MKPAFSQTGFTIELTEDGSPTLRLPNDGESMHHSGGAATETNYIYKKIITDCLRILPDLQVSIVGLGLAYIEIAWAQSLIEVGLEPGTSQCVTYETMESLKDEFRGWLSEGQSSIYNEIARYLNPNIEVEGVRQILKNNFLSKNLYGDLLQNFATDNRFNLVCYDAFSSKTSTNLWTEDFLNELIKKSCHEDCVFTTYACTTNLKKALLKNNFTLLNRPGFKGKRQSTLAARGRFMTSGFYQTF